MKKPLTDHQREALDAYFDLVAKRPDLFAARSARPIVLDRETLEAYAAEQDVVLGVAATTPYTWFVVDLVESRLPGGGVQPHPYLRILSVAQLKGGVNVVILATIEEASLGPKGSIVLVSQERHALGVSQRELPRGFGEAGLSGEANALLELEEETGFVGDQAYLLGTTTTDSGLMDATVSFYHVPVLRRAQPKAGEPITKVELLSPQELRQLIQSGTIRDGFTVQALALLEMQSPPHAS